MLGHGGRGVSGANTSQLSAQHSPLLKCLALEVQLVATTRQPVQGAAGQHGCDVSGTFDAVGRGCNVVQAGSIGVLLLARGSWCCGCGHCVVVRSVVVLDC